jgi:hypothetical protein
VKRFRRIYLVTLALLPSNPALTDRSGEAGIDAADRVGADPMDLAAFLPSPG